MIDIQGLRIAFGKSPVLDGLDWQVQRGTVVGLVGRNAAGKTTLIEATLGLRDTDAGRISVLGENPLHFSDAARARIGYVPQRSDLFEWMTPSQLLRYFRSFYPRWDGELVEQLLRRWDIPEDQLIGKLSGGQQQRLSIIRALAHRPDLLLLDEPVSALDPAARRDFIREIVSHVASQGTTIVFSTHQFADLERVALQVAFLQSGRILLQAGLDDLLESTRKLSGDLTQLQATARSRGWEVLASTEGSNRQGHIVARGEFATDEDAARMSLEDLFVEITR
jgi:ABC-2 type transport system ATP-binding protein